MKKATILTIEDDHNLQVVIESFLEEQGYEVLTGSSGTELLEKIQATHVDAILLDLGLPDSDGLNLMSRIRAHTQAPVIVVSGKSDPTDKILGLEMGADDYIGKPFQMRELYARIKAVLRRAHQDTHSIVRPVLGRQDATRLSFGEWIMDRATFSVVDRQGRSADLTASEFKLLEILLNGAGRVLKRCVAERLEGVGDGAESQAEVGAGITIRHRKDIYAVDFFASGRDPVGRGVQRSGEPGTVHIRDADGHAPTPPVRPSPALQLAPRDECALPLCARRGS